LVPRFTGSNLGEDNGFLRVIKIYSTTSFRGEVKPEEEEPYKYEEILHS
jgi:hypothetical protein